MDEIRAFDKPDRKSQEQGGLAAKVDAKAMLKQIEGLEAYLGHVAQEPFRGAPFTCPVSRKDLAKVVVLFYYCFFFLVLLLITARKCCPSRIE